MQNLSKPSILILEDNKDCLEIYKYVLSDHYDLELISTLKTLTELDAIEENFKILIADIRLPDGNFLDWIVNSSSKIMEKLPTIIVSSLEDMDILRNAFEWGAVDYFVKPFKGNELLVKLENILKLSPSKHKDFIDELTLIETKLFQLLSQSIGKVVSREEILRTVWKKVQVNPKTLDVHLSNLRKKILNSSFKIESEGNGWKLLDSTLETTR